MSKINEIAEKRKALEVEKVAILSLEHNLSQTIEWEELDKARARMLQIAYDLKSAETEYKAECVKVYATTGEKEQLGGQVKVYTVLDFDQKQARAWAIVHNHATLLKLNVGEFKKVAKTLKPDFVTITEEPKMTLARDLSEFLGEDMTDFGEIIGDPTQPDITETME